MTRIEPKRPFAVFDIDGTLIRWQLFHAIVHGLGKQGHLPAEVHERIGKARMEWKARKNDEGFGRYEDVLVREYLTALKQLSPGKLAAVVDEVFEAYKDQTYAYTRDFLKNLKAKGYFLLAISGSHQEAVQKLAVYYGFDDVVGAAQGQINGRYSGAIDTPIFDKAKVLRQLIARHGLSTEGSIGVGDSKSDASMLQLVDNPIAFNPNKELFAIASEQHWKVVVERKNMVYELEPHNGTYTLKT